MRLFLGVQDFFIDSKMYYSVATGIWSGGSLNSFTRRELQSYQQVLKFFKYEDKSVSFENPDLSATFRVYFEFNTKQTMLTISQSYHIDYILYAIISQSSLMNYILVHKCCVTNLLTISNFPTLPCTSSDSFI